MKLAFCVRPDYPKASAAMTAAADRARKTGADVVVVTLDSAALADEVRGAEIACVFGGDGTMLRAARAFAPLDVALLGVNLGHLGFLTGASVEDFDTTLLDVLGHNYKIEERTLLHARLVRAGNELLHVRALNDIVVARGALVRSIHISVAIDGEPLIVYWADGLVAATATGSTAYGFSVGGPLILPSSSEIMIVPIAPHLSFGNAVVLDPEQTIELTLQDEPARLSIDGQDEHDLHAGDRIEVRRSRTVAKFVRTASMRPFLALLRQKILKEPGT